MRLVEWLRFFGFDNVQFEAFVILFLEVEDFAIVAGE